MNDNISRLIEELAKRFEPETVAVFNASVQLVEAGQMTPDVLIGALQQVLSAHEGSITDPLTGLYNRKMFDAMLEAEVNASLRGAQSGEIIKQAPLTLALIDVDGLRNYNNRFGHPEGDTMLRGVGKIFRQHFRGADVLARFGGDEFAAIMPRTFLVEANGAVQRMMGVINNSEFGRRGISLSVGLCNFEPHSMSKAEDFYKITDRYLYNAKKSGGNAIGLPGGGAIKLQQ